MMRSWPVLAAAIAQTPPYLAQGAALLVAPTADNTPIVGELPCDAGSIRIPR